MRSQPVISQSDDALDIGLGIPPAFRIRIMRGPNTGSVIESSRSRLSVGSAPDNDLVLHDPLVSRRHLIVLWRAGHHWVHYAGTESQVLPHNYPTEALMLRSGSELMLGDTTLRFEVID
jgi:predicted component of type VI protein secretion system